MSAELIDASTGEIVALQTQQWRGAASRGLEARQEREAIVSQILTEGHDFGVVPGCGDKPALLKPGAEKIADALALYPDYEELDKIQDFINKIWFYRYRCRLRQRGSDLVMSTGIGSCNSETAKYKYRNGERTCPACGKAAIIKGREEYGGGWLCFARKGGCGQKYADNDHQIVSQSVGQVENPDIASVVNTVDKMAQKSAFVAACLNLGFSEQFTQDIEDMGGAIERETPRASSSSPQVRPESQRPAPSAKAVVCPDCGGPTWDNREGKRNPKAPDYKCKDKGCNGAIWLKDEQPSAETGSGLTPKEGAIAALMAEAEKLLPPDSVKLAQLRGISDPDELGKKVQILLDIKKKKSGNDPNAELQGWRDTVRASFLSNALDESEYLIENYDGANLDELSIEQLKAINEDINVPF